MNRREFLKGLLSLSVLFVPKVKEETLDILTFDDYLFAKFREWYHSGCQGYFTLPDDYQEHIIDQNRVYEWDGIEYPAFIPSPVFVTGANGSIIQSDDGCVTWQIVGETCCVCGKSTEETWDNSPKCQHCNLPVCWKCYNENIEHNKHRCKDKVVFSGINHIINTGYQDIQTESRYDTIESNCSFEIEIHYDKCS